MNRPLDLARAQARTRGWIVAGALACALVGAPQARAQSADEMTRLLDGFRDNRYAVREAASRALLAIGAPAVATLRSAQGAEDPEVRWRVRTLLDALGALDPPRTTKEVHPFVRPEEDAAGADAERVEMQLSNNGRVLQVIRNTQTGELYYDVDGTRYRAGNDRDMEIFKKLDPSLYSLVIGLNRKLAPPAVPAPDEFRWPTLGAQIVEPRAVGTNRRSGELIVIAVIPGSPAEKLGILEGDRILKVNGMLATNQAHLPLYLKNIQIGQVYSVLVVRKGEEVRLEGRRER